MSPSAINATNVRKAFGKTRAVAGATVRVEQGMLVALLGPSGSGKTTLLRIVAGFEVPDAGSVWIGGRQVAGEGANGIADCELGRFPTDRALHGTVEIVLRPERVVTAPNRRSTATSVRGRHWPDLAKWPNARPRRPARRGCY